MGREYQIPGGPYVNETGTRQYQIPGGPFLNATYTSGGATLTPARFDNSSTFYAPTVTPGAVTLTPSLASNSQTFYAATVTASYAVTQDSRLDNSQSFYAPTVTPGGVTLTPALYSNSEGFYSATVTPGEVALTPGLYSNDQTFYGPTVAATNITASADVSTTGWTASTGNDLYAMIDETDFSDVDYITSPPLGTGDPSVLQLTNTLSAGTYDVSVRADYLGTSGQVKVSLLNGSDVSQGSSSWQAVTDTATTYVLSVTTTGDATRIKFEVQA